MSDSSRRPTSLQHFPVTAFGITMGLSGTSLAWRRDSEVLDWTGILAEVLAWTALVVFAALTVTYLIKVIRFPHSVRRELANPATMPFAGTFSISLMLLAATFLEVMPVVAKTLWWLGATAQIVFTVGIVRAWIAKSGITTSHIHPAWLIPMIGMLVAPVGGVDVAPADVNWFFWAVGFAYYVALLPLVLHRLIAVEAMPARLAPTLAVLVAPPAIAATGWVLLGGSFDDAFARVLLGLVSFHLLLLATQVTTLIKAPFALSAWAYTFPLGSASVALLGAADADGWAGYTVIGALCLVTLTVILAGLTALTARMAWRGDLMRPQAV